MLSHEYRHVLFSLLRKEGTYLKLFPSSLPKALFPLISLLLIHSIRHPSPLLPSLSNSPRSPFKKSRYLPTYTLIPPKGVGKSYKSNFWTDGRGEGEPRKVFAFWQWIHLRISQTCKEQKLLFLKVRGFFLLLSHICLADVFLGKISVFPPILLCPKVSPSPISTADGLPPKSIDRKCSGGA